MPVAKLSETARGVLASSMSDAGCAMTLGRSVGWVARMRAAMAEVEAAPVEEHGGAVDAEAETVAPVAPAPEPEPEPEPEMPPRAGVTVGERTFVAAPEGMAAEVVEVAEAAAFIESVQSRAAARHAERHTGKISQAALQAEGVPLMSGPGIILGHDADLVAVCLAQGGFPTAVILGPGHTVWVGPGGAPWQFKGPGAFKRARAGARSAARS